MRIKTRELEKKKTILKTKNHQILKAHTFTAPACLERTCIQIQTRQLFRMLNAITNNVDHDHIKEVGPDRACSEWCLRVGAKIRYKGQSYFIEDYNVLPASDVKKYNIEEIDFTKTTAMTHGFDHLKRLKHVKTIKIYNGKYISNQCLAFLSLVKNSLENLEVSNCTQITPLGIRQLLELVNLRKLVLKDLPQIQNLQAEDKETMLKYLQESLPKCDIEFFKETEYLK